MVRLFICRIRRIFWGFDIFVTFENFGIVISGPVDDRMKQSFPHEHARTRIYMQFCHMCKQLLKQKTSCPHEYPHLCTQWIRDVDNLWIMWITPVETAIFRHFPLWILWITLWILWMNTLFGCA